MGKILSSLLLVAILLTGCSNISQKDYDAVVAERDYYKQQYELASGNKPSVVNDDSLAANDASEAIIPSETEMIVEVTLDNYKDYFEFVPVQVDYDNHDGTTTPYIQYVIKSNVYADGWIYKEVSSDFQIDYTDSRGERDFMRYDLDRISSLYELDDPELEVLAVKGRVKFEHISAVKSYEMDDFKSRRTVVFSDGKRSSESVPLPQGQYPY